MAYLARPIAAKRGVVKKKKSKKRGNKRQKCGANAHWSILFYEKEFTSLTLFLLFISKIIATRANLSNYHLISRFRRKIPKRKLKLYSLSTLSIPFYYFYRSYHDRYSVSASQYSILIKNRYTRTSKVSSKILGVATSLQLTTTNLYALPSSISGLTNTQRRIVAPYSPWTISNYVATHRSNSVCSLNVHRAQRRTTNEFQGGKKKNLKLEAREKEEGTVVIDFLP